MTQDTSNNLQNFGAVVLATRHDSASSFVYPAAQEVSQLLCQTFTTISLLPFDGSENLFVEMFASCCGSGEGCKTEFVLGYLSAHGSDRASLIMDQHVVFDEATAKLFSKNAILVLTACLLKGGLAEKITNESVSAVIGYTSKLLVPGDRLEDDLSGEEFEKFKMRFLNTLVSTVHMLLQSDKNARDAYEATLKSWHYIRDTAFNSTLRTIAATNAFRLRLWGKETARLVQ